MYLMNPVTFQVELLDGVYSPDPSKWGWTSEEERYESGLIRWPGQAQDIVPCNANLKLYGRAAFNRVLHEYKCVACSIEWPPVSEEWVRLSLSSLLMKAYQWMTILYWFCEMLHAKYTLYLVTDAASNGANVHFGRLQVFYRREEVPCLCWLRHQQNRYWALCLILSVIASFL